MVTRSPKDAHAARTATEHLDHAPRLVFSNSGQREAHIQAFLAWLPKILHDAPGIRWERLSSQVMGYLIRNVTESPDAVSITLAVGCAMEALRPRVLYSACHTLTSLLRQLRRQYGMVTFDELGTRAIWDRFVERRMISGGDLGKLKCYDALASTHRRPFEEGLTRRQQVIWQPYLLPPLPHGFLQKKAQRKAVETAAKNRRKEQSEVILPLFPLLVEIAQLRKQAAERLIKEFRRQRDRVRTGEIALPYRLEYVDRQFSLSEQATTLAAVQLVERKVTLSFTLWNRMSWVKEHLDQCGKYIHQCWKKQIDAYTPERNTYFLQYEGAVGNLLWCGDLIEQQLLGTGKREGLIVTRPGLLYPANSDVQWLSWARKLSGAMLFDPESLYRGALFATALATLSLTNGSRVSELLQVSACRFETIVVDEPKNQQPTGRQIGLCVQKLLPKGYAHESERQFFLISDMAVRLLKEIAQELQAAHGGIIPIVHPEPHGGKADDLSPEPYFFQWAASEDGRVGQLTTKDVTHLLRFLFHGLTLTTKAGEPIRIAAHLLRHVLATHARTVQNVPAEAIAYLLHHRVTLEGSSQALTIPEATAYYSRLPVGQLLALLADVQSTLVSEQGRSYLHMPDLSTLEQKEAALRRIFEQWGMIGPTVLGFCSAGMCVRASQSRHLCQLPVSCPSLQQFTQSENLAKILHPASQDTQ